jgi:hypothetical protein
MKRQVASHTSAAALGAAIDEHEKLMKKLGSTSAAPAKK